MEQSLRDQVVPPIGHGQVVLRIIYPDGNRDTGNERPDEWPVRHAAKSSYGLPRAAVVGMPTSSFPGGGTIP